MDLRLKLGKHFEFSHKEVRDILIVSLVVGFMLSFRNWGVDSFDAIIGIKNLILFILLALACFIIRISVQKFVAIKKAVATEFRMWPLGLFFALYISLISNGDWYFIIPGGLIFDKIVRLKIDRKTQEVDYKDMRKISMSGVLTSLIIALLAYSISLSFSNNIFVHGFVVLNFTLALCTMIPVPQFENFLMRKHQTLIVEGLVTFYSSRSMYLFWLLFVIIVFATHFYLGAISSIVLSFLLAAVIATTVWFTKEL